MTILITGGGGAIGRELARIYASRGEAIVLTDINLEGMAETERALERSGVPCFSYRVDTSSRSEVDDLAARVDREVGVVDMLINLAGVGVAGDFLDTPLEEWEWLMGVNLWGYVYMLQAFLPGMVMRGRGHVVNVASAAGLMGIPSETAYCASKFAVVGLTEALYNELRGKGIKVTLVCPSYVRTPILWNSHYFGYGKGYVENMVRWSIEPQDAAEEIVKAIDGGRFLSIPGRVGKFGYYVRRISLRFYLEAQRSVYRNIQKFHI